MTIEVRDSAIIISATKYSENSLIIKLLSENNGIYSGFVKGGGSKKQLLNYQVANIVDFIWRSRTEDGLGYFKIESKKSYLANIIFNKTKLQSVKTIFELIQRNIMERENCKELFCKLEDFLQSSLDNDNLFLSKYINLELEFLRIIGYGLDLESCALGGDSSNLHFVSPRTGRAASKEKGLQYKNKLLKLPKFLYQKTYINTSDEDIKAGLDLTGFFLKKYLNYERSWSNSN
ncbi:DNA repair protein RecO [Rickettsiales bacterium]|nr:DNA repair protein RecO [Rickettsiales bacterium]